MSATGHERRRREAAAQQVIDALDDVAQFVRDENLPCKPTLDAVAAYLPTHDRVSLEAMAERVVGRRGKPQAEPTEQPSADDTEKTSEGTGEVMTASETVEPQIDPEAMARDEMVAFLEGRGQTVGARAKDETLRQRVAEALKEG